MYKSGQAGLCWGIIACSINAICVDAYTITDNALNKTGSDHEMLYYSR